MGSINLKSSSIIILAKTRHSKIVSMVSSNNISEI